MLMSIEQALQKTLFQYREINLDHGTYDNELLQYVYLKNGDMNAVSVSRWEFQHANPNILSRNTLRGWKYMFVVYATLSCRFAMDGGLDSETAYTISDLYIQRADQAETKEQIFALHDLMVEDYTKRMANLNKQKKHSLPVIRVTDYVQTHLNETITLKSLAAYAGTNESYLSSLFSKEMGITISKYIRMQKIEAAKTLLIYYEFSVTEISEYFSFSSVSHFIRIFKQQTGVTPTQYRREEFRQWKPEGYLKV